jgi:AcrR family transcriptional regulator
VTATDTTADTRSAILAAAAQLFARQGLAATTIKEIGAEAGVNPALLYYYFASKEALYLAVLQGMIEQFAGGLAEAGSAPLDPADGIQAVLTRQAEVFLAEPLLPRLIARELADHEARLAAPEIRHQAQRLLGVLTALVERGQENGTFRRDVSPRHAAISALAQLNWFCIAGPAIEQILDVEGAARDPATVRAFASHAVEFTLRALRAAPNDPAGGGS